jgi:hypothetical protein
VLSSSDLLQCRFTGFFLQSHFWFEVASKEKLQEKEQVASIHDKGCCVVLLFNATGRVRLVVVKTDQSDNDADDHLRNLKHCDEDGIEPLRTEFHGHQKVVTVHGGMDAVVHHDEENARRGGCNVGMPAVQ